MVNNETQKLNTIFSALSDPTRRAMLARLTEKEMSVMELAEPFDMSKPAITKHLKVLENAGLLKREIKGRVHHCSLKPGPLNEAAEWLSYYAKFWNEKFDSLEKYFQNSRKEEDKDGKLESNEPTDQLDD